MTDSTKDLVDRLREACWTTQGIALVEEAASALTAAQARIAELEGDLANERTECDGQHARRLDLIDEVNGLRDRLATAERERDEARETLAQLRRPDLLSLIAETDAQLLSPTQSEDICRYQDRLATAERERDEARAALAWINAKAGSLAEAQEQAAMALLSPSASTALGGDQTGATKGKP